MRDRIPSSTYSGAEMMPDRPALSEASTSALLLPMLDTIPMPVTTTLRIKQPPKKSWFGFQSIKILTL